MPRGPDFVSGREGERECGRKGDGAKMRDGGVGRCNWKVGGRVTELEIGREGEGDGAGEERGKEEGDGA